MSSTSKEHVKYIEGMLLGILGGVAITAAIFLCKDDFTRGELVEANHGYYHPKTGKFVLQCMDCKESK